MKDYMAIFMLNRENNASKTQLTSSKDIGMMLFGNAGVFLELSKALFSGVLYFKRVVPGM
jgi:hypothetical protein